MKNITLIPVLFLYAVMPYCLGAKGVDIEANLSRIPAVDPDPSVSVSLLKERVGQHPRLLFTRDEIDALREQIKIDPILKEQFERLLEEAHRFKPITPNHRVFKGDTAALVQSNGRLPGVIYAYMLTGDAAFKDKLMESFEAFVNEPHWAHSSELDSTMGAGNNMIAAGLLFDALYHDLEPSFRKKAAQKLLTHVRRMYYLGHLRKGLHRIKYWQNDTHNNHRWHRNAGMAACLLSIADEGLPTGYMMEQFKKEMDLVLEYYPEDGDCHEGSFYQEFGFHYLCMGSMIMDRSIGTEYLKHPGFANAWKQQYYSWIPGKRTHMSYGDAQNKPGKLGHLGAAFFMSPRVSRDKVAQGAMEKYYQAVRASGDWVPYSYPWQMLLYYDPTLDAGDASEVPNHWLMHDMGVVYLRDGWDKDSVVMMFKCGPYGGYRLNEYRNERDFHYVNIAHDDPDANTFALAVGKDFIAHPGVYFKKKQTEQHNTLIVDGKGQIGEGNKFTQPIKGTDMTTLSYLTAWKSDAPTGRVIVEGEAGNAYPGLERYRRVALWMPEEYVVLLDYVEAKGEKSLSFLSHAYGVELEPNETDGVWVGEHGTRVAFMKRANKPLRADVEPYAFTGRWNKLDLKRSRFDIDTDRLVAATLINPWGKEGLGIRFKESGDNVFVEVSHPDGTDVISQKLSDDLKTPSTITVQRDEKTILELSAQDTFSH